MAIGVDFKKRSDRGGSDIWAPVAMCDVCGSEISDGRAGVYLYDQKLGAFQVPTIACKGSCHEKAEREMKAKGASVGWMEMYAFVGMLKGNVMLKSTPAGKKLADEAESGELES
jgi:hypothetical protein